VCDTHAQQTVDQQLSMGPISSTQPYPTHQMTGPTQLNPSHSKNFGPTNQPNPQPITQSNSIQPTTNLWAYKDNNFSQSVKVYQVLIICQVIRHYFSSHKSPTKFYRIFGNVSDPQPNPTQPNPWTTLQQITEVLISSENTPICNRYVCHSS